MRKVIFCGDGFVDVSGVVDLEVPTIFVFCCERKPPLKQDIY